MMYMEANGYSKGRVLSRALVTVTSLEPFIAVASSLS